MDPRRRIEQLQKFRGRRERDISIENIVRQTAQGATRTHQKLGQLIDLWGQVIPDDIASRTRITALRGGVVHVEADSASDRFELDRLLREGAEAELRRRYRGTLVGVRVKIG
jgi:hypothetical protein